MVQPTPATPTRMLVPHTRLLLWWALLVAYSLQDLILTTMALYGIPTARELNPAAALAFHQGILVAFALKAAGLAIVFAVIWRLARTKHWPIVERFLAGWCIVLLAVNAYSVLQILGGI